MAQAKPKFKQGDIVFVERSSTRRTRDFQNIWTDAMDEFIGQTLEVDRVDQYGVHMKEHPYAYPPCVLRSIVKDGKWQLKQGDVVMVKGCDGKVKHPLWSSWMESVIGKTFEVETPDTDNTARLKDARGKDLSAWFPCSALKFVGTKGKYKDAPKPEPKPIPPKPVEPLQEWEKF